MAKEIDPRAVFSRLFGDPAAASEQRDRARHMMLRRSVLDLVLDDAKQLNGSLGSADRRKLDEYLDSVRQIEHRIQLAEGETAPRPVPKFDVPQGIPRDYAQHLRLMMDLMVLAMQTDTTRVMTFMYSNEGTNRGYGSIGVPEGHHELSHHEHKAEKQAKVQKIDQFHIEQFAYMLEKMAAVREGEGSLLDHSMVLYGSAIADGNSHHHDDLPVLLAGRGGGTIATGRHIKLEKETPMCNLYLSMLDRMGVKGDRFGDSTGPLTQLSA